MNKMTIGTWLLFLSAGHAGHKEKNLICKGFRVNYTTISIGNKCWVGLRNYKPIHTDS